MWHLIWPVTLQSLDKDSFLFDDVCFFTGKPAGESWKLLLFIQISTYCQEQEFMHSALIYPH